VATPGSSPATAACGEILSLAKALGVDPQGFFDIIAGGSLDMGICAPRPRSSWRTGFTPASFAVTTAEKDARLIVGAGSGTASAST